MSSIERRIEKAEKRLSIGSEAVITEIVMFGDRPLPPEKRLANNILRHVRYADVRRRMEEKKSEANDDRIRQNPTE